MPDLWKTCRQIVCVSLLAVFILLVSQVQAGERTVRAGFVPDGDTLFLTNGDKVRIKGVDCPEMGHEGRPAQYYAQEARQYLQQLVRGKELRLDTRAMKKDRFGRLVTSVVLPDGRSLGMVMVAQGYAFCYPHGKHPGREHEALVVVQQRAIKALQGMWARILAMPAAKKRYVGNTTSHRFHTRSCRYGKQIRPANRVVFAGIRQAFDAGFAPCRACTPWPGVP